jgi:PAS domain-containing protein
MINRRFTWRRIFVLAFGLVLYACQTERLILVANSANFKAQEGATAVNRDKKPEWLAADYRHPDDGNFYAVGVSNRQPFAKLQRWSMAEASDEAMSDAQKKAAAYIQVGLASLLSRNTEDTLEVEQVEGKTEVKQESRDDFVMSVVASSSVVLRGLTSEAVFWERYERLGKDGAVREYYTYYVLARISETEIAEERERIANVQDLESEQIKNFETLRQQYNSVKDNLSRLNYQGNETFYNKEYHELYGINTVAKRMEFSDSDSPLYREREELVAAISADIDRFNPQDQQKQVIRSLEDTITSLRIEIDRLISDHGGVVREKEVEIAMLRDQLENTLRNLRTEINNLHSRGVTFVSQYTLFGYPPRPHERPVASEGTSVYIASMQVSNRDYSAFLTATNGNNISINTAALEGPVINVSWIQAAAYCNWLSRLYGYGEYYTINGETIRVNERGNGYRLPTQNEILAGLKDGVIDSEDLTNMGIMGTGSDPGSMYVYRLPEEYSGTEDPALDVREVSGSESDVETGFRVVRNAQG